jgi:hypothetical protein
MQNRQKAASFGNNLSWVNFRSRSVTGLTLFREKKSPAVLKADSALIHHQGRS